MIKKYIFTGFLLLWILTTLNAEDTLFVKYIFSTPIVAEEGYLSLFIDKNNDSHVFLVKDGPFIEGSEKIIPFQEVTLNTTGIVKSKDEQRFSYFHMEDPYYYNNYIDLETVYVLNRLYVFKSTLYYKPNR